MQVLLKKVGSKEAAFQKSDLCNIKLSLGFHLITLRAVWYAFKQDSSLSPKRHGMGHG